MGSVASSDKHRPRRRLIGYCVAVFAALTASALSGDLSHARAAPSMPFYWPLATLAAWRALLELLVRPHHWAKTAHGVSLRQIKRFPQPDQSAPSSAAPASMSASG